MTFPPGTEPGASADCWYQRPLVAGGGRAKPVYEEGCHVLRRGSASNPESMELVGVTDAYWAGSVGAGAITGGGAGAIDGPGYGGWVMRVYVDWLG